MYFDPCLRKGNFYSGFNIGYNLKLQFLKLLWLKNTYDSQKHYTIIKCTNTTYSMQINRVKTS